MQFRAICSEELRNKGSRVYRVLLTLLTNEHPQYMLLNLIDPPAGEELEAGETYCITIQKEKRQCQ
jgi:hypothetical protein